MKEEKTNEERIDCAKTKCNECELLGKFIESFHSGNYDPLIQRGCYLAMSEQENDETFGKEDE